MLPDIASPPASLVVLPDVGEGLTEAEIVTWHVKPGDVVAINDVLVEIETAKAVVELPSPHAGVVADLLAEEGAVIPVGTVIATILGAGPITPGVAGERGVPTSVPTAGSGAVLVGYGTAGDAPAGGQRRRRLTPVAAQQVVAAQHVAAPDVAGHDVVGHEREAGERIPVRGVARSMAEAMSRSASQAPQATVWREVDMTAALEFLRRCREDARFENARPSLLALAAAAAVREIVRQPRLAARWDARRSELVLRPRIDIGIAVATDRGLVVPHLLDVGGHDLAGLSAAVKDLIRRAREGRATPAELAPGSMSITNVGVLGVDGGTPILSPDETSILLLGRVLLRPWILDGAVVPRRTAIVSLTFDHRWVDGAMAGSALGGIADYLSRPGEYAG